MSCLCLRGWPVHPAQPLSALQSHPREFWVLPSPSQVISLSSWGLDGRKAEIHRCFSLLGRGRCNYAGRGKLQWFRAGVGTRSGRAWVRCRHPWLQAKYQAFAPNPTVSARATLGAPTSRLRLALCLCLCGAAGPLLRVCLLRPCSQQQLVPGALPVQ